MRALEFLAPRDGLRAGARVLARRGGRRARPGLWRALWTRRFGALWDSPLVATSWPRRSAPKTFGPDFYCRFALAWCEWAVAGAHTRSRCLVAIRGVPYDLTLFLPQHPGSETVLEHGRRLHAALRRGAALLLGAHAHARARRARAGRRAARWRRRRARAGTPSSLAGGGVPHLARALVEAARRRARGVAGRTRRSRRGAIATVLRALRHAASALRAACCHRGLRFTFHDAVANEWRTFFSCCGLNDETKPPRTRCARGAIAHCWTIANAPPLAAVVAEDAASAFDAAALARADRGRGGGLRRAGDGPGGCGCQGRPIRPGGDLCGAGRWA